MSDRRDSNPRPSAWEANALPTEPLSRLLLQNYNKLPIQPKNILIFANIKSSFFYLSVEIHIFALDL